MVTACDDDESTIDAVMQQGAIASANAVVVVSEVIDPALMAAVLPMHACQNKTKKSSSHSYCWPAGRPQLALSCMSRKT